MTRKKFKVEIPPPPGAETSKEELASYFEKYGMEELEALGYVHDLSPEEQKEMDNLANKCQARVEARKRGPLTQRKKGGHSTL